jgi:hypothetical protein
MPSKPCEIRFIARHQLPVVLFRRGQRKDDVMVERLRDFQLKEGGRRRYDRIRFPMAAFGASQRRTRGAVNAGEKMHRRGSARDRSEFLVIKLLARLSLAGLYLRGSITGFPSPTPPNSPGNMATRLTVLDWRERLVCSRGGPVRPIWW